jgi:hypothetical protein
LSKIVEEAESQEYLDVVERVEPEVDELVGKIAENLNINIQVAIDRVSSNPGTHGTILGPHRKGRSNPQD